METAGPQGAAAGVPSGLPSGVPGGVPSGVAQNVLRIPAFRRLYFTLALSSFGDWLGFLATTALASQFARGLTDQAYATSSVLVLRLLPSVLFGAVAGAFADRWDRRITMVVCDVLRFALFVSIPVVGTFSWLLAATFLIEALSLFWIPAKEASVPNMVPREKLESANQLSLIAAYGSAPIAAGVFAVLGLVGRLLIDHTVFGQHVDAVDLALYTDALTFLVAAIVVFGLRGIPSPRDRVSDEERPPSLLASLREGVAFMRGEPLARGLITGMLGALAAGGAIIAQGKLIASRLGGGDSAYGLLFGALFVGIALGIGVGPKLLGDISRRSVFGPSIVLGGAGVLTIAVVPNLALVAVTTVLVGAGAGLSYVIGLTLLGAEVADDVRGRTFGLVATLMRIDLLVVTGLVPLATGAIGTHDVAGVAVNGLQVTLALGGLLGITVGVLAARQLGSSFRSELRHRVRHRGRHHLPGTFLVFEGGEGAGKSTQVRRLAEALTAAGHEVLVTREPGATPAGARLRALLLDPATGPLAPRAEALLYAADRADHVKQVIRPALERGCVVVCDRYVDSSLAYQGGGRDLPVKDVAKLSEWATDGLVPDLTLLLDIDPAVGLARSTGAADRIEAESLTFHQAVRQTFLELSHRHPDRYLVVSAELPADEVAAQVAERVLAVVRTPELAAVPA